MPINKKANLSKHDQHGLLSAPIPLVLRQMTVPMIFGLLAILMFNVVDTFFISLLGTQALAAISFTFPITYGVNCITTGIGVGLSTNVARLLGTQKIKEAARFATHGLLLAILLILFASIVGFFTIEPLFRLLGAEEALIPLIKQYMQIWYITIPLLVVPMAGNSAIRATGDTKSPAKIMLLAGVINGILDPLLIFGYGPFPELGIQGAAIATGISWFGALCAALYIQLVKKRLLAKPQFIHLVNDWRKTLKIGTPAALSNAMTPLSSAILMMMLAKHGTEAIAAYGAAQRIESILLIVLVSLTSILTPFMAQNLGAHKPQRSFQALFSSMHFAVIFQLIIFIMIIPLSVPLSTFFSQEQTVRNFLWHYLLIVPFSYGFQGILMMLVSGFNAFYYPLKAFLWSIIRLFIFILPSAWFGSQYYGVEGLFMGIACGNILGGSIGYIYAQHFKRHYCKRHDCE